MVSLNGQMVGSIEDIGRMENSMGKESFIAYQLILGKEGIGMREEELIGLMKMKRVIMINYYDCFTMGFYNSYFFILLGFYFLLKNDRFY